ncbi:MAG TPA: hypothetical protein VHU17_07930, partial [Acidimicrobiales bacterium]|nr:hypothetical protein [Acidimicrobiales bacterium]
PLSTSEKRLVELARRLAGDDNLTVGPSAQSVVARYSWCLTLPSSMAVDIEAVPVMCVTEPMVKD